MVKLADICSRQNDKFKEVQKLAAAKYRKKKMQFGVEGRREIERALAAGMVMAELWFAGESLPVWLEEVVVDSFSLQCYRIPHHLFEKLVMRKGSADTVYAVFHCPTKEGLDSLKPLLEPLATSHARFLVLDGVEKPGNLGAILRTADAAGVDAVFVLTEDTVHDLYHPHVIRASLGAVFSQCVLPVGLRELRTWLGRHQVACYRADLCASSVSYVHAQYDRSIALLLGSEAFGPSAAAQEVFQDALHIDMCGIGDSLNVSAAAAVFCYKMLEFKHKST
ncbi:MAG: hypothetical protein OXT67_01880 [Zetaproteobacteria bacterium]|nr:hypothetical protein [Zetaproteobacteria bacterium]